MSFFKKTLGNFMSVSLNIGELTVIFYIFCGNCTILTFFPLKKHNYWQKRDLYVFFKTLEFFISLFPNVRNILIFLHKANIHIILIY